jgi:hypothetical protein
MRSAGAPNFSLVFREVGRRSVLLHTRCKMFDVRRYSMRTTLAVDDDVFSAPREMAAMENKSVGEVISSLARRALAPAESRVKTRNGVPLLKVQKGSSRVTSELVHQLREDYLEQISTRYQCLEIGHARSTAGD